MLSGTVLAIPTAVPARSKRLLDIPLIFSTGFLIPIYYIVMTVLPPIYVCIPAGGSTGPTVVAREVYADERRRGAVLATPGSSPSAPQEAQESRAVYYAPALSETEIGRTRFIRPSPHRWWGGGCRTGVGMRPTGPSVPPGSCRPSGHRFVESRPRAAEYRKSLTSYRPFHSPTILGSAYRSEPSIMSLFLASEATCIRTLRETGGRWCHRECHK
jgi:hypothetical protein